MKTLAGGSYVVLLHEGTHDHFQETYDRIVTAWLPAHAPARTELARTPQGRPRPGAGSRIQHPAPGAQPPES